jgi:nitrogen regulatory protein PII
VKSDAAEKYLLDSIEAIYVRWKIYGDRQRILLIDDDIYTHTKKGIRLMTSNASIAENWQRDKKSVGKKRVEAFIISEKIDSVLSALESLNLQVTFYESRGMGKGEKETVRSGRGTGPIKMPYSTRRTVVTIVDENKVQDAIVAIRESATTGKVNAGIIVISPVEEIISI